MQGIGDEYERRLVPATDEEICCLAREIWEDPRLRMIFTRVGYHGDMTDQEERAVAEKVDSYRTGDLWDRDGLHLALAPCLVRLFVSERLSSLAGDDARSFLTGRMVKRVGRGLASIPTGPKEVISLAKQMMDDDEVWQVFQRVKFDLEYEPEEKALVLGFMIKYIRKYGLFNRNRAALSSSQQLLRRIAAGLIKDLDCPEAWEFISGQPQVSKQETAT